jgi:PadR family transcriptional regulator
VYTATADSDRNLDDPSLYNGLLPLFVLHRAASGATFGQRLIDELGGRGYRVSAGRLYPILHGLERDGFVRSRVVSTAGRNRRIYGATSRGRTALVTARRQMRQLFGALLAHI